MGNYITNDKIIYLILFLKYLSPLKLCYVMPFLLISMKDFIYHIFRPMHWGGRLCDDNGDPKYDFWTNLRNWQKHHYSRNLCNKNYFRCPSLVRYGLGPVPDTYYVDPDNAMPDYDQLTTVYAGDKHLIELKVKANTRIRLENDW